MIPIDQFKNLQDGEVLRFDGDFPLYCLFHEYHGPVIVDKSNGLFWDGMLGPRTVGVFFVLDGKIVHSMPARRQQLSAPSVADIEATKEWQVRFDEVLDGLEDCYKLYDTDEERPAHLKEIEVARKIRSSRVR